MPYTLTMRDSFTTDLMRLPRELQKRMEKVNAELRQNPIQTGGNIKKLKGFEYLWRYRLDDYRMIYAVVGNFVEYLAAGARRDIYERFNYDPENPDDVAAQQLEAQLFPDSNTARKVQQRERWEKFAYLQAQHQIEAHDPPLPEVLSPQNLAQWNIPSQFFQLLSNCRRKSEFDKLFDDGLIPLEIGVALLDHIYPKHASAIADQPIRVLTSDEDLTLFVEGRISQFLLKLDPQQEALVDWALDGPTLVKGGPGSGKSTVAMYRVRAMLERAVRRNDEAPSVLFTTFTNALVSATEELLNRLLKGLPGKWEVTTVDQVTLKLVRNSNAPDIKIANRDQWREALAYVRPAFRVEVGSAIENALVEKTLSNLENDYLIDEFEWVIEGRGLNRVSHYLAENRTGRGQPFPERLRRAIWSLYELTKGRISKQGFKTWGDIRKQALESVQSSEFSQLRYDYVIVDEAQDLTPLSLRICMALVKDPKGIFLAADSSQSIYNRGFSFSKVDAVLNVSHRTRFLGRNYRSTREIAEAAQQLLNSNSASDNETLSQTCMHFGPKPVLAIVSNRQEQIAAIVDYIRRQSRLLGLPTGGAAILCPTNYLAEQCAKACRQLGLPASYVPSSKLRLEVPEVKVMTIHAAKGLEFPIVAIPFLEKNVLPRVHLGNNEEDQQSFENHERRLLFVGVTRAMRRIIVTTSGINTQSPFVADMNEQFWDHQLAEYPDAIEKITEPLTLDSTVTENTYRSKGRIHKTERGEFVRSRAEVIIANALAARGIEYHYEQRILGEDDTSQLPDFTINHHRQSKPVFWEHLGMLEDPGYRLRWEQKRDWYHKQGILDWVHGGGTSGILVVTQEDENGAIDSSEIARIINKLFT